MAKQKGRYVVVTTDSTRRGVFGGILLSEKNDVVELAQARMAVYWCSNIKGVVGLSVTGPLKGSRISPACPKIRVNGVTAVMDCTPEARAAWEAGLWT